MATHGPCKVQAPPNVQSSSNTVKRVTFSQSLTDKREARKQNSFTSEDGKNLLLEADPDTLRAYRERKGFTAGRKIHAMTTAAPGPTTPTERSALMGSERAPPPPSESAGPQPPASGHDYFGVKSYLHQFYEGGAVINPEKYDDIEGGWGGDYRYLIRPRSGRSLRRSFWWKIAVWSGVNFLVVGILVILVGNVVPHRPVVVGVRDEMEVVDRSAVAHNYNLEVCKIVGIVLFCAGGTVVAVALLLPSFLLDYSDEIWDSSEAPFGVVQRGAAGPHDDENCPLREKKVPATQEIARVQPPVDVYKGPAATVDPLAPPAAVGPAISGDD